VSFVLTLSKLHSPYAWLRTIHQTSWASCLLAWPTLQPWRWRQFVPSECHLLSGLYFITIQKIKLFICNISIEFAKLFQPKYEACPKWNLFGDCLGRRSRGHYKESKWVPATLYLGIKHTHLYLSRRSRIVELHLHTPFAFTAVLNCIIKYMDSFTLPYFFAQNNLHTGFIWTFLIELVTYRDGHFVYYLELLEQMNIPE
jgi:hypothetical protein